MSTRLHLRKVDKSESIKSIVYPQELEGLGKLYDEQRKEICLLVKTEYDSFYQVATNVLCGILSFEEMDRLLYSKGKDEIVQAYPNGSNLWAKTYNNKAIEDTLKYISVSRELNEFLNDVNDEKNKAKRESVKYLIELYKFIVNNQLELLLH